jgi:hypothetical protein
MATKTNLFACRLSDADFATLHANAERLEITPSSYVRYLIRIPATAEPGNTNTGAFVIDTKTLHTINYELIRWGRHYNQGIHALNSIALAGRKGKLADEYFMQQIELAHSKLDAVEHGREEISYKLQRLENMAPLRD